MTAPVAGGTLRFLLGDQLSLGLASLRDIDPGTDVVLMAEVMGECTYVRHHVKKIVFVLSAMRHFAEALRAKGIRVDYRHLTDADNSGRQGVETRTRPTGEQIAGILIETQVAARLRGCERSVLALAI
jgi:deoxyribodipyrimidine photolyase-related protein